MIARLREEKTMERRYFFQTALASAAGLALLPRIAGATEKCDLENVIFSEDSPGHWKGKEKLHVPLIEIKGDSMTVTTPHPMSEAHFIVSHSVVLQGGQFLGRKTFTWKDAPVSTHVLPAGFKGKITVTSTCNQHDWWINEHTI
jgi:superoxide reductase